MEDITPDLKLTRYLIDSCYGWTGWTEKGFFDLNSGGLVIWNIWNNGTIEGLHQALVNAQTNSDYVKNFNKLADTREIPRDYGTWKMFSVIEKFDDREQQVNVVVPEGMSEEDLERFCAFKVWRDRGKK